MEDEHFELHCIHTMSCDRERERDEEKERERATDSLTDKVTKSFFLYTIIRDEP